MRFAGFYLAITWWYELVLPRIGLAKIAERTRSRRMQQIASKFHALAIDLGGLMIKVGQFMSSRLDVLPSVITAELEGLQDEVHPVPFAEIRTLAERELGVTLERAFESVEETPLAAASFGQAHRARLLELDARETGLRDVVIKVQRPGIDEIVAIDLAALRKVGGWLSRVQVVSRRVDMPALIEEFAVTSAEELDYLHEAVNAERFAENFREHARVSAPAVVWERTSRKLLTLEDVAAVKITDVDALVAAGIDPKMVASVFAAVMFDQLFTHGFFHADPHPGNIFVTPSTSETAEHPWQLTFIDFGMMGEVANDTRAGLRKLLFAVASRDGKGLVDAIQTIGVLLPSAETSELERAMTQLFARFGGMGFSELRDVDPREFRDFSAEFGSVVRSLPFQLPDHFMLIIRSTSLTSGVCSALDPQFNLWDSVEPYAAQLLRGESANAVRDFAMQAVDIVATILRLPQRVDAALAQVEDRSIQGSSPKLEHRLTRLERMGRRILASVLFAALLITGGILRSTDPTLGTIFITLSAVPLILALIPVKRGH